MKAASAPAWTRFWFGSRASRWPPAHTLITGAGGALGTALAERIAPTGGTLSLCDRDHASLAATAARCEERGATVATSVLDVRDGGALDRWIRDRDGVEPLACVVANAATSPGRADGAHSEPLEHAIEMIEVNLIGVLHSIYPAIDRMSERGFGQIVLIASLASYAGFPRVPVYAATKAAVRVLGQSIDPILRRRGIQLLVACPGFFQSAMSQNDCPRPGAMSVEHAAARIETAVRRGRGRVSFPAPLAAATFMLAALPFALRAHLYRRWLGG